MEDQEKTDQQRRVLRIEIEFLNTLASLLKAELNEQQTRNFKYRSMTIKLALMEAVWGPDWGDFDEFKLWIEGGGLDPVPQGLEIPLAYYRAGLGEER